MQGDGLKSADGYFYVKRCEAMSEYIPDKWVVIEIDQGGGIKHQRVFAGWYGGYLHGDSWKMNSGIKSYTLVDDVYEFHGESGSVYKCHKDCYGMSLYMQSVFESIVEKTVGSVVTISIVKDYLEVEP